MGWSLFVAGRHHWGVYQQVYNSTQHIGRGDVYGREGECLCTLDLLVQSVSIPIAISPTEQAILQLI